MTTNNINQSIKKLYKSGGIHIFIGSFLNKFITFFASIFLVRVLSKSSYGLLSYIDNIYAYFYLFAGLGLSNAVFRYVAKSKSLSEEKSVYKYVLRRGTIINLVLLAIIIPIAAVYPHKGEFEDVRWLLVLALIALPFNFLIDVNLFLLRSKFKNRIYAYTILLFTILIVSFKFFGAILYDLSGVVIGKLTIILAFSILFLVLIEKYFYKKTSNSKLEKIKSQEIKNYSLQYMITNGFWMLITLNDIFMLGILGSTPELIAEYKVANVLPANLAIISLSIGIFITPYFIKNENNSSWIKKNYVKAYFFNFMFIFIVGLVMFILSDQLVLFLYGTNYQNVGTLMKLLVVSAVINSGLRFVPANLLAGMGKIRVNLYVSFFGVFTQIILNFILIPKYSVFGAAITGIIIYSLMTIVINIYFLKVYISSKKV